MTGHPLRRRLCSAQHRPSAKAGDIPQATGPGVGIAPRAGLGTIRMPTADRAPSTPETASTPRTPEPAHSPMPSTYPSSARTAQATAAIPQSRVLEPALARRPDSHGYAVLRQEARPPGHQDPRPIQLRRCSSLSILRTTFGAGLLSMPVGLWGRSWQWSRKRPRNPLASWDSATSIPVRAWPWHSRRREPGFAPSPRLHPG
jgi:hypothetical protein